MVQKEDHRVRGAIACDAWFFPVYHALNDGVIGIQDES
jgi:hypothetical protein